MKYVGLGWPRRSLAAVAGWVGWVGLARVPSLIMYVCGPILDKTWEVVVSW